MVDDDFGKEGGIDEGSFLSIGEELEPADDLTGGILDGGEVQAAYLGPEFGDIVEVFGIETGLFKEAPLGFDRAEVLFGAGFAARVFEDTLLSPDAADGFFAQGEVVVALEAFGAPCWEAAFEVDDLLSELRADGRMRILGGTGALLESFKSTRVPSGEPLSDGFWGSREASSRGFDSVINCIAQHGKAQICWVFTLSHNCVIW